MRYLLAFTLLLGGTTLTAQTNNTLSLDEAIGQAIEQNLGLQVEKKNVDIAENSATKGNAGLLPSVGINSGYQYSNTSNELTIANTNDENGPPREVSGTGVGTENINAQVAVTYNLFDGFRGKYTFQQLESQRLLSDLQYKARVEIILLQVIAGYIEVARQNEQLQVADEAVKLSADRLQRAKGQFEYGNSNRLTVLQAQVDLSNDSVAYRDAELKLANAKRNLNRLIGRELGADYGVNTSVNYLNNLVYDELLEEALVNNTSLGLSKQSRQLAEYNLGVARSGRYPTIQLTGQYGYNRQETDFGLLLLQQNLGFTGGVSLRYNLFNGGQTQTQVENAQLAIEQRQIAVQDTRQQLENQLLNAFATYENNKKQLQAERNNLSTFEENFERAQEDFRLGLISATDLRASQLNLIRAKNRIITFTYNTKLSEVELLQISGRLIQSAESTTE